MRAGGAYRKKRFDINQRAYEFFIHDWCCVNRVFEFDE